MSVAMELEALATTVPAYNWRVSIDGTELLLVSRVELDRIARRLQLQVLQTEGTQTEELLDMLSTYRGLIEVQVLRRDGSVMETIRVKNFVPQHGRLILDGSSTGAIEWQVEGPFSWF